MGSSHKKQGKIADNNAKKSKIFTKLVRLIQVEAKKSNGDVNSAGLASAMAKALKANMPRDNIERAIKKASDAGDTQSVLYEVYGPGGVGMIVTGLTDNNNRTSSEIKHLLSKNHASLGATGSVSWNFTKNQDQEWEPGTRVALSEEDQEHFNELVELLEENDDIQDVYHNAE